MTVYGILHREQLKHKRYEAKRTPVLSGDSNGIILHKKCDFRSLSLISYRTDVL